MLTPSLLVSLLPFIPRGQLCAPGGPSLPGLVPLCVGEAGGILSACCVLTLGCNSRSVSLGRWLSILPGASAAFLAAAADRFPANGAPETSTGPGCVIPALPEPWDRLGRAPALGTPPAASFFLFEVSRYDSMKRPQLPIAWFGQTDLVM